MAEDVTGPVSPPRDLSSSQPQLASSPPPPALVTANQLVPVKLEKIDDQEMAPWTEEEEGDDDCAGIQHAQEYLRRKGYVVGDKSVMRDSTTRTKRKDGSEVAGAAPTHPGRQKIAIEYIDDKGRRNVTQSKRTGGLFKKGREVSTLCGASVLQIVMTSTMVMHLQASRAFKPFAQALCGPNNPLVSCIAEHRARLGPSTTQSVVEQYQHGGLSFAKVKFRSSDIASNQAEALGHLDEMTEVKIEEPRQEGTIESPACVEKINNITEDGVASLSPCSTAPPLSSPYSVGGGGAASSLPPSSASDWHSADGTDELYMYYCREGTGAVDTSLPTHLNVV